MTKLFKSILSVSVVAVLIGAWWYGRDFYLQQGVDSFFEQCYNNGPAFVYQVPTDRIIMCGPMAPPSVREKKELDKAREV